MLDVYFVKEKKLDICEFWKITEVLFVVERLVIYRRVGMELFKRFFKIMAIIFFFLNVECIEVFFKNLYRRIILCNCKREFVR